MKIRSHVLWCGNRILRILETKASASGIKGAHPLFIIGPPRSGTTLLYQLMIHSFELGYISNRHARWYGGMSFVEALRSNRGSKRKIDFNSNHGQTKGTDGPSECGPYWYQFFSKQPQYANEADFPSKTRRWFHNSMTKICRAFGRPVVFKNVMNSGRLTVLERTLPEAVFIEVLRDPLSNGESILEARYRATGRYDTWWSLEPKGFERYLNAAPEVQVAKQIELTREMIEQERPARCLQVAYEDFIVAPHQTMSGLREALMTFGIQLHWRNKDNPMDGIPSIFESRRDRQIPDELSERLCKCLGGNTKESEHD